MANAIIWMKLSKRFFWASSSSWFSSAMAAWDASASTMFCCSGLKGARSPVSGSVALIS